MVELAKYPADSEEELSAYDFWVLSGRVNLPKGGGYLDQPAPMIAALKRIETKARIVKKIDELDQRISKQQQKLAEITQDMEEAENARRHQGYNRR